jgi:hypothetical protein
LGNGDFNPHVFVVGAAATLGFAIGATMVSAANEVAIVVAEHAEETRWDQINTAIRNMLRINAELELRLQDQAAAFGTIMEQYKVIADLAVSQAQELAQLRAARAA